MSRAAAASPPGAVVFDTSPIAFAVREPLPGVDLDAASPRPGLGVALRLHCADAPALHAQLVATDVEVVAPLTPGPFGSMFSVVDVDGYVVTVHGDPA